MDLTDVFVGRTAELRTVTDPLKTSCSGGVLIAGPTGAGKSRLATEALRLAKDSGHRTAVVLASAASRRVPLGAFSTLPDLGSTEHRATLTSAELVAQCAERIEAVAGAGRLVLHVDDAQLLDDMSLLVLEQLTRSDRVYLVLTARTGEAEFETLSEMSTRGMLASLTLSPLDRTDAYALVEQALSSAVDSSLAEELFEHSEGNPLFLLELLRGSLESNRLVQSSGTWRLDGGLNASARVREVVEARIRGLNGPETELLELLSFVDSLTRDAVDKIADASVIGRLEARGLIKTVLNRRRLILSLAHPIYGDVLRSNMSGLKTQDVTLALAEYCESEVDLTDDSSMQLASLRLICGGGDHALMQRAARIALSRHDVGLALECADAAIELGGGFDAHILKARILGKQGEFEQADNEIVDCLGLAVSDDELAQAAVLRLDFHTFYRGHVNDALLFTQRVEERISDPALKDSIAVRRAGALLHTDGPKAAVDAVDPILARGTSEVESWACMLAGWGYFRLGKTSDAYAATRRGDSAQNAHSYPSDWYPELHGLIRCYVDAAAGRITSARAAGQAGMMQGEADNSDEAYAGYALFLASLVRDTGHTDDALSKAQIAVEVYQRLGRTVYFHDAIVHRAIALAMAGRGDDAMAALEVLDEAGIPTYWYFSPELHQARAWASAANGHRKQAKTHFIESARVGAQSGDLLGALTAWHGLARIGFPRQAVDPMKRLVRQTDSELAAVRLDHVIGLATHSGMLLQSASERFESSGALLLAGEAAVGASAAFERGHSVRTAETWKRRATAIFRRQDGPTTAVLRPRPVKGLTTAEFDTARQAAQGRSNAEIAENLGLSIRTVENRLQRVYVKLGVNTRQALFELSETTGPGLTT